VVNDVFFDFFGTLVDYNPSVHPVYNAPLAFARRAGCAISPAESDAHWQEAWDRHEARAVSTGREYSMREVALRYWHSIGSPSLAAGAVENLVHEYLDAWTESVFPAAHALECVTDLAADHRLTIVTNTHDPNLVPGLVRRFGLGSAVDRVVPSVAVGWRKPHPAIYEAALRDRGAVAGDAVFVGDSWEADVEGPRRIGMHAIYVGRPSALHPSASLRDLPQIIRSGL
jgi:putative hydrolase of the HAD superfamily